MSSDKYACCHLLTVPYSDCKNYVHLNIYGWKYGNDNSENCIFDLVTKLKLAVKCVESSSLHIQRREARDTQASELR